MSERIVPRMALSREHGRHGWLFVCATLARLSQAMAASKMVRALNPNVGDRTRRYSWYPMKVSRKPIIQGYAHIWFRNRAATSTILTMPWTRR